MLTLVAASRSPRNIARKAVAAPAALVLVASRSAGPDHAEPILRADLDGALDAAKRHARTVFASMLARFDGKCAVAVEIQADGVPVYVLASEGGAL